MIRISQDSFSSAQDDLDYFLNNHLAHYDARRNYDFGALDRSNVSGLSKYISHRVLCEYDVVQQTLKRAPVDEDGKLVKEVFWRIYWKGWLEHRPSVWHDFVRFDTACLAQKYYRHAVEGRTGIACFDAWVAELQETNYLHNHARMWFASIWIFTLGLPWQAGARFFQEHLLDGDAASNTLGWRWVAGIQTKGKHYLARSNNIEKYTKGRFGTDILNEQAEPIEEHIMHEMIPFDYTTIGGKVFNTLIICDTDLHLPHETGSYTDYETVFVLCLDNERRQLGVSHNVLTFKKGLVVDFQARCAGSEVISADDFEKFASQNDGFDVIYPSIGDNLDYLKRVQNNHNISVHYRKKQQDLFCWQFAQKGFFNFKRNIPHIIEHFKLSDCAT